MGDGSLAFWAADAAVDPQLPTPRRPYSMNASRIQTVRRSEERCRQSQKAQYIIRSVMSAYKLKIKTTSDVPSFKRSQFLRCLKGNAGGRQHQGRQHYNRDPAGGERGQALTFGTVPPGTGTGNSCPTVLLCAALTYHIRQ